MEGIFPDIFSDVPIIRHSQKETIESLKEGDIEDLRMSCKLPVDHIANYGLETGLLQEGLKCFPDPRKRAEIPIEVLLLPQIIQRLNDEHSLVTAPYMLNSAELIMRLGYSAKVLREGFNNRNRHPRETPFHGETLKHILLSVQAEDLVNWFNEKWSPLLKEQAVGDVRHYVMDGMKIHVPPHLYKKFEGAGCVDDGTGNYEYGYKVVWIYEIIDRKGIIRGMEFASINVHDLKLGKRVVENFAFAEKSLLLMDRGFFDGKWITSLKRERGIDVCLPLKSNMFLSELAVHNTVSEKEWRDHPTREGQRIRRPADDELHWDHCPVFESGVLVNFKKRDGKDGNIVILDTREGMTPERLLETYDLRSEIEECHRQLKCFQGLEKLPSKKYPQVVFRVIMGTLAYNLFNLFLNSQKCDSLKDYTLKLYRQKRRRQTEENPDVIIYTKGTFGVMRMWDFLQLILGLSKNVQKKLQTAIDNLSHGPSP